MDYGYRQGPVIKAPRVIIGEPMLEEKGSYSLSPSSPHHSSKSSWRTSLSSTPRYITSNGIHRGTSSFYTSFTPLYSSCSYNSYNPFHISNYQPKEISYISQKPLMSYHARSPQIDSYKAYDPVSFKYDYSRFNNDESFPSYSLKFILPTTCSYTPHNLSRLEQTSYFLPNYTNHSHFNIDFHNNKNKNIFYSHKDHHFRTSESLNTTMDSPFVSNNRESFFFTPKRDKIAIETNEPGSSFLNPIYFSHYENDRKSEKFYNYQKPATRFNSQMNFNKPKTYEPINIYSVKDKGSLIRKRTTMAPTTTSKLYFNYPSKNLNFSRYDEQTLISVEPHLENVVVASSNIVSSRTSLNKNFSERELTPQRPSSFYQIASRRSITPIFHFEKQHQLYTNPIKKSFSIAPIIEKESFGKVSRTPSFSQSFSRISSAFDESKKPSLQSRYSILNKSRSKSLMSLSKTNTQKKLFVDNHDKIKVSSFKLKTKNEENNKNNKKFYSTSNVSNNSCTDSKIKESNSFTPIISDARKKARNVLCKVKGDPNYYNFKI